LNGRHIRDVEHEDFLVPIETRLRLEVLLSSKTSPNSICAAG
jgi:hypothetical protein